jgi:hypothetical protein
MNTNTTTVAKLGVWVVCIGMAALALIATAKMQPPALRRDIDALANRVEYLEELLDYAYTLRHHDQKMLTWLRRHVESPRFARHRDKCDQCRGDTVNTDEGGPAPLCEEGFRLLQEDSKP